MHPPTAAMLFDSHCHLTDERLRDDVDAVVERARAAGVARMLTVGADPEDAERASALAARYDAVWAAVGIHPHVAGAADAAAFDRIRESSGRERVVALGETGLDFHYDNSPRQAQRRAFERHVELAAELGLPLVVHSRAADADTAGVVRAAGGAGVRGVLHCFTGGSELLDAALDAGWHVSFAGLVTFRNFGGADLLRAVPSDRLLVETDSPYLAPVPHRGKRNEPAYVRLVADAVADLRGEPRDAVERQTFRNACALYGLPV